MLVQFKISDFGFELQDSSDFKPLDPLTPFPFAPSLSKCVTIPRCEW
jgi:hypothetical protein